MAAIGEEVLSRYWVRADANTPVTVRQLAAYHTQGNTATVRWYTKNSNIAGALFTQANVDSQSLLPHSDTRRRRAGVVQPGREHVQPDRRVRVLDRRRVERRHQEQAGRHQPGRPGPPRPLLPRPRSQRQHHHQHLADGDGLPGHQLRLPGQRLPDHQHAPGEPGRADRPGRRGPGPRHRPDLDRPRDADGQRLQHLPLDQRHQRLHEGEHEPR